MAKTPTSKKDKAKKTTFRQQAEAARTKSAKPQRVRKAARAAGTKPFRLVGEGLGIIFRPFRFVLRPFKTRPMRFIGRILYKVLLIGYFKNSWLELRKVTWPDRKQTVQLTVAVFAFAIVFGVLVFVVDLGLDKLFKQVLLK